MSWLLSLIDALMSRLYPPSPEPMPEPIPVPQNSPVEPVPPPESEYEAPHADTMLETFCGAIKDFEGAPGQLNYRNNNPGNCRCSKVGYLPKYGNVRCVNNFAVFETWALGWEYLLNLVNHRASEHPNWTITDFFNVYAPTADSNDPNRYARFVAARCGVPVNTTLATLFG